VPRPVGQLRADLRVLVVVVTPFPAAERVRGAAQYESLICRVCHIHHAHRYQNLTFG
jgi:hypothetical protein